MKLVSSLLMMSFYWLCLYDHVFVVSGHCLDDQRSLLLQLKNNLTFSDMADRSNSRLSSWNASSDCCRWMGVSCDKEGYVTGLDLSGESISRGFDNSSSLFSLHHLQKLNLAQNDFSYEIQSEIPSAFSKLQNLTYLNLLDTGFVGQIPKEISQLTRLVSLYMSYTYIFSYNFITDDQHLKILNPRMFFQNLTSIRQLYFHNVIISAPGHEWCTALMPLRDLQELTMTGCYLSGPLDPSLARLENLSVIVLDWSDLSSPVPQTFASFKNLRILSLSECRLNGTFPQKMFNIRTLLVIDISYNNELLGFIPDLPLSGSLQTLRVTLTRFSGAFPHSIGNMGNLSTLDLSGCGFNGTIPNSLSNLTKLSYLDLSNNNFIGPVTSFSMAKKLTNLDLSNNDLSGIIPSSYFEGLHNLGFLDLSYNSFTGSVPSSVFTLSSLSVIGLSHNGFSQLDEFTNVTFSKIKNLGISNNNLSGTIPSSLFTLPLLETVQLFHNLFSQMVEFINVTSSAAKSVDISNNNLSGTIPSSLFSLPLLETIQLSHNLFSQMEEFTNVSLSKIKNLDISYNNLSGTIPSSLFTLPHLQSIQLSFNLFTQLEEFTNVSSSMLDTLDLSENNLSGPFPKSIFQLGTLSVLQLSSNKINGLVQVNKLFELKNLLEVDLSYNNLSFNENVSNVDLSSFPSILSLNLASCNLKTFPGFLRNLSTLTKLDLSGNQIQGVVPSWIWKPDLLQLQISHNFLTGFEGPLQSLTSNLVILDLHDNKLQGSIPIFPNGVYLDYSSNKFSSIIPRDIGYLSQPQFLSLSNNTLHGSIPDSLCNLSVLRVLDLSINNISGTIPSCLMKMGGTLQVLKLKNNNLSGHIPDTIPGSCSLWSLNLSGNLLDGAIPNSLSNCSTLEVLDLGSNQIIGGFPCSLQEISALRVLVLRNNKFQGSIKCSKANKTWEMLQIVDIAFNNFSDKLSGKYFSSWTRNIMHNDEREFIQTRIDLNSILGVNYQDRVTVISKSQKWELVKILTIFTSFDFSSNHFEGPIPKELMDFKELYILNMSNNALSGEIPSSIGNMRQLESLDISHNSLSGEIPVQLASLSFLSYLDLSFNHLVGKIPTGTQLQSFPASSFEGNDGLYGPPLTEKHGNDPRVLPQPECRRLACTIDWNFISVELGLVFGHGIVFGPLLIWKRWRVWYWQFVHKILCWIFPQLYLDYVIQRGQTYETLRWWWH